MPEPVGSSWADEIEEGDVTTLPPSSEKIKGDTKMVTDYSFNEDNKKVKTVRTYKIERKMVPKIVAERRAWHKFGMSKDDKPGPNPQTTVVAEEIWICDKKKITKYNGDIMKFKLHQKGENAKKLAQRLSGGMKRKLSLAIALIGGSEVLFLDEPSAAVGFDLFGEPMDRAAKRRLAGATVTSPYDGPLDFNKLYTGIDLTKYWDYSGSFTTPPCTEAVDFYIMMTKQTLSQNQLNKFKAAIGWQSAGGNFRPTQPVNHRLVSGCAIAAWYPAKNDVWAKLVGSSSNTVCEHGTLQSPIDFAPCTEARKRSGTMDITWADDINVTLTNNGHTVTLAAETTDSPGLMKVGGKTYKLVQCHFHYSSKIGRAHV